MKFSRHYLLSTRNMGFRMEGEKDTKNYAGKEGRE
jgi:hypothetical protein